MTVEMKNLLQRDLEDAKTQDDVNRVLLKSMSAVVDCQYKTAERVKEIRIDRDREKHRHEGAKWLWGILAVIGSSGGGTIILWLLKHVSL